MDNASSPAPDCKPPLCISRGGGRCVRPNPWNMFLRDTPTVNSRTGAQPYKEWKTQEGRDNKDTLNLWACEVAKKYGMDFDPLQLLF